jgi:sec-independent protein translocase protein TatA
MPFNIGAPELIILLVLALIIFGPGKLPEVGNALGKTFREFRHASNDLDLTAPPQPKPQPAAPETAKAETSVTTESESAES